MVFLILKVNGLKESFYEQMMKIKKYNQEPKTLTATKETDQVFFKTEQSLENRQHCAVLKARLEPNFITKSNGSRCISKSREWTSEDRKSVV